MPDWSDPSDVSDPVGPIVVECHQVGPDRASWSRHFPVFSLSAISREARRVLASWGIFAVYDRQKRAGAIFAGAHQVGTFTVREEGDTNA